MLFPKDDEKTEQKQDNFFSKLRKMWRSFFEYRHELIEEEPSFYAATLGQDREEQ